MDWDTADERGPSFGTTGHPVKPPWRYLTAAAGMVALAVVLLPVRPWVGHAFGWVLGSVLTVGLLAVYTAADQRLRLSAWYSAEPGYERARKLLGLAGIVIAAVHSWHIAYHFAS